MGNYTHMIDLLAEQKRFILNHLHEGDTAVDFTCLLYTSPSPRD